MLLSLPNNDWIDPHAVKAIRVLDPSVLELDGELICHGARVIVDLCIAGRQYITSCIPAKTKEEALAIASELAMNVNIEIACQSKTINGSLIKPIAA